jgi:hypothetical protein
MLDSIIFNRLGGELLVSAPDNCFRESLLDIAAIQFKIRGHF